MKTMQWVGVLGLVAWSLGGGLATGSEDKPVRSDVKEDGKAHGRGESHPPGKGEPRININEASKAALMKLDGVSAGTAQKIIAYRETHGPFKRAHDLGKVEGVGKEVLERNLGRITVK